MRALHAVGHPDLAAELSASLKFARFVVDQADSGAETLDFVSHYEYDVIIVDGRLPDMDGCDLLARLRRTQISIPVIMLSSRSLPMDAVKAFHFGADDVVAAPFHPPELLARVQAVIRRNRGFSQSALSVGPLVLHLDQKVAFVDSRPVHLSKKEYALLELLTLRKGIPVNKDTIMNHLYGGMDEPEPKIIDVFICKIRKKLSEAGADGLLGTVWGQGYVIRDPRRPNATVSTPFAAASSPRLTLC
jgi:two-component system cell cycle response regulator CtrA